MVKWIEPVLYWDPQRTPALFFCPICGGERYGVGQCLRCERRRK